MHSYHVAPLATTPGKRLREALLRTAAFIVLFAAASLAVEHKWPSAEVFGIALFAEVLSELFRKGHGTEYDLEVDEGDGLRMVTDGSVTRRVRKDHVHYVREWGTGPLQRLVVSEHGPAFSRWLGRGIGVPASLPEYEKIRSLALGWLKEPGS